MKEDYILTIKSMVYGQLFVDTIDQMKGNSQFKQQLKKRGNAYHKEVEKFLNIAYQGGSTDKTVIELLENCEKQIERIVDEKVSFED